MIDCYVSINVNTYIVYVEMKNTFVFEVIYNELYY